MDTPDLLEVGRIDKPHGLRGEVVVTLTTNRLERVAPGADLHTEAGRFTVVSARPLHRRWIVQFAEVTDRNGAERLRGLQLDAEPLDDAGELWVHELIGCEVVDADGVVRGVVELVEANQASDLLVLDTGHLVPVRFVVDGPEAGRLRIEAPVGLFDAQA